MVKCKARNCKYNNQSCCSLDYVAIDNSGRCKPYKTVKYSKLISRFKSEKRPYNNVADVFQDYYFGSGIKHCNEPDNYFNYGDIVTTGCGWDFGFHSGCSGKVYARPPIYNEERLYGDNSCKWYKTGINLTWREWVELNQQFKEKINNIRQ